jgi:hypothetical protein
VIQNGFSDFNHMQEDAGLDPSRDLPAFAEIMKAGHLDRHYAALWSGEAGDEAMTSVGLDPATHLLRCRELESQGYRMVATSLARTGAYGTGGLSAGEREPLIGKLLDLYRIERLHPRPQD